jgi:hypothetical protein
MVPKAFDYTNHGIALKQALTTLRIGYGITFDQFHFQMPLYAEWIPLKILNRVI